MGDLKQSLFLFSIPVTHKILRRYMIVFTWVILTGSMLFISCGCDPTLIIIQNNSEQSVIRAGLAIDGGEESNILSDQPLVSGQSLTIPHDNQDATAMFTMVCQLGPNTFQKCTWQGVLGERYTMVYENEVWTVTGNPTLTYQTGTLEELGLEETSVIIDDDVCTLEKSDAVLVLPEESIPQVVPQNKSAMSFPNSKIRNDGCVDILVEANQTLKIVFWTTDVGVTDPFTADELISIMYITTQDFVLLELPFIGIRWGESLDISTLKIWYDPYYRANGTFNLIPQLDADFPNSPPIVYEDNIDNNWFVFEDFTWESSGPTELFLYANPVSNETDLMFMILRSDLENDSALVSTLNTRITDLATWYALQKVDNNLENYLVTPFQSLARDNCGSLSTCEVSLQDSAPFMSNFLPSGDYIVRIQTSVQDDSPSAGEYSILLTTDQQQIPASGAVLELSDNTFTTYDAIPSEQELTLNVPSTFRMVNATDVHWLKFSYTAN
jgi:hypothetical protein